MSFLSELFGRKKSEPEQQNNIITEIPGCECEIISDKLSTAELTEKYLEEYGKGKAEGYTPVILLMNPILSETIEASLGSEKDIDSYHSKMLSMVNDNGREYLKKIFDETIAMYKNDSPDFDIESDLYGDFDPSQKPMETFSGIPTYESGKTTVILARVPVSEPWKVFAFIPFGGWNACPADEDIMSVCKYWYEEYRAVPAVISGDTLQMYCFEPVADNDAALHLAEEHYAFCNDAVDQCAGYIRILASWILRSKVWYFWWD